MDLSLLSSPRSWDWGAQLFLPIFFSSSVLFLPFIFFIMFRKEMEKYRDVDEDELLQKLSEEELRRLEDELEELDPDVSALKIRWNISNSTLKAAWIHTQFINVLTQFSCLWILSIMKGWYFYNKSSLLIFVFGLLSSALALITIELCDCFKGVFCCGIC